MRHRYQELCWRSSDHSYYSHDDQQSAEISIMYEEAVKHIA